MSWQPAPWSIGPYSVIDGEGKPVIRDPANANMQIEILAPEMADAIIDHHSEFNPHHDCYEGEDGGCITCKLIAIGEKLREMKDGAE